MGRGKVELRKIENRANRQVTFCKRRMGLFKKANELAILCDAQIGVIAFSGTGRMYEYSSPPWRIETIFDRYLKAPSTRFEEKEIQQKIIQEMTRMKDERNRLRTIMGRYMGEDLGSFSMQDLSNLEQHMDFSLYKLHLRKQELLDQQMVEMHQREMNMTGEQSLPVPDEASGDRIELQPGGRDDGESEAPWWDVGASGSGSQCLALNKKEAEEPNLRLCL